MLLSRSVCLLPVVVLFVAAILNVPVVDGKDSNTYTNPVDAVSDMGDPSVLADPNGVDFYLISSSLNRPDRYTIRHSTDLVNWEVKGAVFPEGSPQMPSWPVKDFWAAEMHFVDGKYIVYYPARDNTSLHCLGAAYSTSPLGPYTDLGRPLLRDVSVGLIDPHHFWDPVSQKHLLYFKGDYNAKVPPQQSIIWVQELAADGLSLVGERTPVLHSEWSKLISEQFIVEAPWMIYENNMYYLFYSTPGVNLPIYSVHVARSSSPFGPFEKAPKAVLHTRGWPINPRFWGPGHCSVLRVRAQDGEERLYIFASSWEAWKISLKNYPRLLVIDRVQLDSNGWLTVDNGNNCPSETLRLAPLAPLSSTSEVIRHQQTDFTYL